MTNCDLKNYGFKESTEFTKLLIDDSTVGASNVNVKMHGFEAKGMDCLEVGIMPGMFKEIDLSVNSTYVPDFSKDNIILGANYYPAETVVIEEGNKTVDLNNKTITAPVFIDTDDTTNSYGLWVKGGEVVITGNGEIVSKDSDYSMAVWANGGKVTIKGGIFRNGGDSCDLIYASAGGNVVIEGGEFFPAGPASGTAPGTQNPYTALNVKDKDFKSGASSIIVKGGRFHNFNPANNLSEGANTNFVAEGYESVEITSNVWEVRVKE